MQSQREWLEQHITQQYGALPRIFVDKIPHLRRVLPQQKPQVVCNCHVRAGQAIGLADVGELDIANVKLPPEWITQLSGQHGFAPAYHMNKKHWLSLRLDNMLPSSQILDLLKTRFEQTR